MLCTACTDNGETQPLRLGTNIWPGYEPLYLARELGYLDHKKIRLVEYTSASKVLSAYRNGLLDAAALTLDEVLILLDAGEDPQIILVTDISNGGDALLGQSHIQSLEQLTGKKIGVEHNALGAYFINRVIVVNDIDENSFTIVPLKQDEQERAFIEKRIDATFTFEPVKSRLINKGANVLFDSSQIPGEIIDVIVVNKNTLSRYEKHIAHLKIAWFKALETMQTHPDASAKILGRRLKMSNADVLKSYSGIKLPTMQQNQKMLEAEPIPDLYPVAQDMSNNMFEMNLIKSKLETHTIFGMKTD